MATLLRLTAVLSLAIFTGVACSTQEQGETEVKTVTETVTKTVSASVGDSESPDESETTSEQTASEQEAPEQESTEQTQTAQESPEDTLATQYQYLNSGQYEQAYELFAPQSKEVVSLEQYLAYFEARPSYAVDTYSFNSVDVQGDTAVLNASLSVSGTNQGPQSYEVTQEMARVGDEWRTVMRDAQISTFTSIGENQEQAEGSSGQESADVRECAVGASCELDRSTIVVTNVQPAQSISAVGETYQGNFVIVEFSYTYNGSSPTEITGFPFELEATDGTTYSYDFDVTSSYGIENDRSLVYEEVQPGVATEGSVVFEVAPDASGLTLYINRNTEGEVVAIPLGI